MLGNLGMPMMELFCTIAKEHGYLVSKQDQIRGTVLHTFGFDSLYNRTLYLEYNIGDNRAKVFAGSKKVGYIDFERMYGDVDNWDETQTNRELEMIEREMFDEMLSISKELEQNRLLLQILTKL